MERYHFFASSCHQFGFHCKSLSELKSDESEPDGALATILKVLQQTHSTLFDPVCPYSCIIIDASSYCWYGVLDLLIRNL